MKKSNQLKLLLLTLFGVIIIFNTYAGQGGSCQASFVSSQYSNGTYIFTNTSQGGTLAIWNINGDYFYGEDSLAYTFTENGSYFVCLTITSDSSHCYDYICDSILVTGLPAGNPSGCEASFFAEHYNNGTYIISNTSQGGTQTVWNINGDHFYGQDSLAYTFTENGWYTVCLTITSDSLYGGGYCYGYVCDSILVTGVPGGNPSGCEASFVAEHYNNGTYIISNTSQGGTQTVWNINGDHFYGQDSLAYTFTENGLYVVCLTITSDSLYGGGYCYDYVCDSILVTGVPGGNPSGCEASFSHSSNAPGVYYFENTSNSGSGSSAIAQTVWTINGTTFRNQDSLAYVFEENGTYEVCLSIIAHVNIGDSNALCCADQYCELIEVTGIGSNNVCTAGFEAYSDTSGQYTIVINNTSTGNQLSYFWDFGDGNYSYEEFPTHTYESDSLNYEICLTVIGLDSCVDTYCMDLYTILGKNGGPITIAVLPPVTTGIVEEKNEALKDVNVYPNPFKGSINVALDLIQSTAVTIVVTDVLGNTVAVVTDKTMAQGNHVIGWEANELENGLYLMTIQTPNLNKVERLLLNR